ncbi:hypothetical protein KVR01_005494 [Diaporthe batatas]|uniref:proteasome regulatory particle lid subunit RPN13 n=1 Tax=Diaporthe batatas TaxID=748121 RepID=UPI001D03E787|nr:proteasome regulatory particle lid subunit RPN13 [Diaporthe batatas]KAG8165219.1 hypothetical protein KVR01_005494 [Diaporthe batatas]
MSLRPIITFKAGICEVDQSTKPYKVKPSPRPGYIYLYQASDDDLLHFCWRERSVPADQPELDLTMIPGDGTFVPVEPSSETPSARTQGRIFVLKFESSSTRHLFWLQSHPQSSSGDATWLSPRDRKIGEIVNNLLQGDEVDVNAELASVGNGGGGSGGRRDADGDESMEDTQGHGGDRSEPGSGGAGADATGGDVREEGEEAREGGSDGARAASNIAPDAAAAVRNFLNSLNPGGQGGAPGGQHPAEGKAYPLLSDLLEAPTTVPMVRAAEEGYIDSLLYFLPPSVLVLAQQGEGAAPDVVEGEPGAESAAAAIAAMTPGQKKALLEKVLRSPQFHQSLASLTMALRDGGLPSIAEALGVKVENGGYMRGGGMPLGGGDAVEAFVEGVKKSVQDK